MAMVFGLCYHFDYLKDSIDYNLIHLEYKHSIILAIMLVYFILFVLFVLFILFVLFVHSILFFINIHQQSVNIILLLLSPHFFPLVHHLSLRINFLFPHLHYPPIFPHLLISNLQQLVSLQYYCCSNIFPLIFISMDHNIVDKLFLFINLFRWIILILTQSYHVEHWHIRSVLLIVYFQQL